MKNKTTFMFLNTPCIVNKEIYGNDRLALQLYIAETGEPMATATVNIPDCPLEDGEILIKNWSENAGILEALASAGYIEDTGKTYPTGWTEANICKYTGKML